MIRISYDHQIFSSQEYGGISRYFVELATRIAQREDCDVTIAAPMYFNKYLRTSAALNIDGIYIPRIPKTAGLVRVLDELLVSRLLRSNKPDIVHETYYCGRRLAPKNAAIIVTIHDMIYEKFPGYFPKHDKTSDHKRAAVARADHVICVSENTRRDLIDIFGVDKKKISVVHHGFSSTDMHGMGGARPIPEPYILYVGTRSGYKNFDRLLSAYSSSNYLRRTYKLVCFGGGAFSQAEMHKIAALGLSSRVVHKAGDDDALVNAYRGATAFVYPSLYEGFGIPLLEAMASKCAVICSKGSSFPEVCGDAAEYFDAGDVESIRFSLEKVLMSDSLLDLNVMKGTRRVQGFSWERCASETASIYSNFKHHESAGNSSCR